MSGKPYQSLSAAEPVLEPVHSPFLEQHGIQLSVLRLDQIHPLINGNKWFKLQFNIESILASGHTRVLSFGGAWSNHLHALACAGKYYGFQTIGVIRGELPAQSNPVLDVLRDQGMHLHSVSRHDYRNKTNPDFIAALKAMFGDFYLLPEGGSNELAVRGCAEIAQSLRWQSPDDHHLVALACGTGATMAGVVMGLESRQQWRTSVLGVSVLKAIGYMHSQVTGWLQACGAENNISWTVSDAYHCGGYARRNAELEQFLSCFEERCSVPLEPVYSGKLALALYREIGRGAIPSGTEIIAVHSGGLVPGTTGFTANDHNRL